MIKVFIYQTAMVNKESDKSLYWMLPLFHIVK